MGPDAGADSVAARWRVVGGADHHYASLRDCWAAESVCWRESVTSRHLQSTAHPRPPDALPTIPHPGLRRAGPDPDAAPAGGGGADGAGGVDANTTAAPDADVQRRSGGPVHVGGRDDDPGADLHPVAGMLDSRAGSDLRSGVNVAADGGGDGD